MLTKESTFKKRQGLDISSTYLRVGTLEMPQLKILLLENHLLAQHVLLTSLHALGQHDIHTATSSQQANTLLEREKSFDILVCNISADHSDEIHFIRKANSIGRIHALMLTSEAEQSTRHAIGQLALLCGYQFIGDLNKPLCKDALARALANYVQCRQQKSLLLTEMFSAEEIKTGLLHDQFTPYYQPKFDLETHHITGVEVLARWNHPSLGIISPAAFIDVARHFNYLDDLMQAISGKALSFIKTNPSTAALATSINIDTTQLRNADFHKHFKQILDRAAINPRQVTVEITEEGAIDASANCLENLINLRLLGCGISIDDFGAGHSSLQRICELPCTEIKLDMSFTKSLISNRKTKAAIQNMVNFSQQIGTELVAEGIEHEEQLNLLRQLNCKVGQGYFFSAPVSGEVLLSLLAHEHTKTLHIH